MEAIPVIRAWAESHQLPLQELDFYSGRVKLLVLNGDKIPGEMTIVGDVTVLRAGENPVTFAVNTCAGRMILDESWADIRSLPSTLDYALGILRRRVTSPQAQWALAFVDTKS